MKPTLLIVEPNSELRKLLREYVSKEFDIIGEVSTAAEALEAVVNLRPELISLEIVLPRVNGLEVVEKVFDKLRPAPGVVVLTYLRDELSLLKALKMGVKDYLYKPISSEVYLSALRGAKVQLTPQKAS